MSKKDITINAPYMERWLGKELKELTPKVLFDIQCLLKHYSSIVVPDKKVEISYPIKGYETPCASVDDSKIFIPTQNLETGDIDIAIGSVIHELNHIKFSMSEKASLKVVFAFLVRILDSIFIESKDDTYTSLKDIVFSGNPTTYDIVMGNNPPMANTSENLKNMFLRRCCLDIAFLLNAVEDVRIDLLCAEGLKKYIKSGDDKFFIDFKEKYDNGDFPDEDLFSICFRLLYHHKGYIEDEFIEKTSPSTKEIESKTPCNMRNKILLAYKDQIVKHVENMAKRFSFDTDSSIEQEGFDCYVSKMELEHSIFGEDALGGDYEDATADIPLEDKDFSPDEDISSFDFRAVYGATIGMADNASESVLSNDGRTSWEYKSNREDKEKYCYYSEDLVSSIKSFGNIEIVEATEHFGSEKVDYNIVIFDATKE